MIVVTVCIDGISNTQKQKRLYAAGEGYKSLKLIEPSEKIKGSITSFYGYKPIFNNIVNDQLQRFGRVKVEATSFTISEPVESMKISPVIFDKSSSTDKDILKKHFDISPFEIKTIKLERIFIDKIFASEFYFIREEYFDVAKHLYDLIILFENNQIKLLLKNEIELEKIVQYKRLEEKNRKGGIDNSIRIKNFNYLDKLFDTKEFLLEYQNMQKIYVFNQNDIVNIEKSYGVIEAIKKINF